MQKRQNHTRVLVFFALVLAAALPLTLLGFLVKTPQNTPLQLPASAIIFIIPAIVASYLVGRKNLGRLWSRALDTQYRKHAGWYIFSFTVMPIIATAVYLLLPFFGVEPGPLEISIAAVIALCAVYAISALCEEIGWMGYAFDSLEKRWGAVYASLVLGLIWALFHAVPWVQVHGWTWSLGWALFSIAIRLPLTLLYVRTGRTLAAVVIAHASINVVVTLLPGFTDTLYAPYLFAGASLLLSLCVVVSGTLRPATPVRDVGMSTTKA